MNRIARSLFVVMAICLALFTVMKINEPSQKSAPISTSPQSSKKSFLQIATEVGTDKVTTHKYQHVYEKYLPKMRHVPIKMLEIGLGCTMSYGPGKSFKLWDQYFTHPDAKIYFMEYDAACAEKWKSTSPRITITTGDQALESVHEDFKKKYGTDFDLIIDDGGHTMIQQKVSIHSLMSALKPGGIYVLEDLLTSYMPEYGGGKTDSMNEEIKTYIDAFYNRGPQVELMKQVSSFECFHEVCVFIKKLDNVVY